MRAPWIAPKQSSCLPALEHLNPASSLHIPSRPAARLRSASPTRIQRNGSQRSDICSPTRINSVFSSQVTIVPSPASVDRINARAT